MTAHTGAGSMAPLEAAKALLDHGHADRDMVIYLAEKVLDDCLDGALGSLLEPHRLLPAVLALWDRRQGRETLREEVIARLAQSGIGLEPAEARRRLQWLRRSLARGAGERVREDKRTLALALLALSGELQGQLQQERAWLGKVARELYAWAEHSSAYRGQGDLRAGYRLLEQTRVIARQLSP